MTQTCHRDELMAKIFTSMSHEKNAFYAISVGKQTSYPAATVTFNT